MTRGLWVLLLLSVALCANGQERATYYGINASQFVNSFISPNNITSAGQLNSFGIHFYFVDLNLFRFMNLLIYLYLFWIP